MYESARERVLEFCEEGLLSWKDVAFMALKFMTETEIYLEDEEDE